jgi:hypothetical protein
VRIQIFIQRKLQECGIGRLIVTNGEYKKYVYSVYAVDLVT